MACVKYQEFSLKNMGFIEILVTDNVKWIFEPFQNAQNFALNALTL